MYGYEVHRSMNFDSYMHVTTAPVKISPAFSGKASSKATSVLISITLISFTSSSTP